MINPNSIKVRYPSDSERRLQTARGARFWLNGEELRHVAGFDLGVGVEHFTKVTIELYVQDVDICVEDDDAT